MAKVFRDDVVMRIMLIIYLFVQNFIRGNGSDSFYEVGS